MKNFCKEKFFTSSGIRSRSLCLNIHLSYITSSEHFNFFALILPSFKKYILRLCHKLCSNLLMVFGQNFHFLKVCQVLMNWFFFMIYCVKLNTFILLFNLLCQQNAHKWPSPILQFRFLFFFPSNFQPYLNYFSSSFINETMQIGLETPLLINWIPPT